MAETVDSVIKKLKLRAEASENALSYRSGVKKYVLPFSTRQLQSSDYLFVQIPPTSGIFRITEDGLVQVSDAQEAQSAAKSFRATRGKRGNGQHANVELPADVREALNRIPEGYKVAYDRDGNPRLARARKRKKTG